MNPDFELVLEDCLARMRAGSDLEECLAFYPTQKEVLRPLLNQAAYLRAIPAPKARPAAVEAGRQLMLAVLDQQKWATNPPDAPMSKPVLTRCAERIWKFLHFVLVGKERNEIIIALRLVFGFLVLLGLAGVFTVKASASAIPGDPLYGVKRTWETAQLILTLQDSARQQLQTQMETERRAEIEKLLQIHRNIVVEFDGVLEQVGVNRLVVSGFTIQTTSQTSIEGVPLVGNKVAMQVLVQSDGQLIAQKLHSEYPGPGGTAPIERSSKTPHPTDDDRKNTPTPTPSLTPALTLTLLPTLTLTPTPTLLPDSGDDDGGGRDGGDSGGSSDDDSGDDDGSDDDSGDDDSSDDDSSDDDRND